MKILIFGATQHFADEVDWILNLSVGIRLPPFNYDSCIDHITCSRDIELQVFMSFRGH
jgi:hypothetical protein